MSISGVSNPFESRQIRSGLNYGDLSVLEQSKLLRNFSYGGANSIILNDIVEDHFSSQFMKDRLSEMDNASLIQAMTALTREIPREATLRQELTRGGRHLPDIGYGELTRRMSESGGIERLARVAAGIGNPYASQDLTTKALNAEISKATARQGIAIGTQRAITAGSSALGPDPFRFVKHSGILSELGMSYFQPNTKARFMSQAADMSSTGQRITQSKILLTNTMAEKMTVRYRDEGGLLAEAPLFELARTQPGARLVQQDITDAAGVVIPIGGAVSVDQTTNVTAGSLNRARLSKVSGQDETMFNIYIAGQGTTNEEAEILSDSLIGAARQEVTELESRIADIGDLEDVSETELGHMVESREQLTEFLADIDLAGSSPPDADGMTSVDRLRETIQGPRSSNWDN